MPPQPVAAMARKQVLRRHPNTSPPLLQKSGEVIGQQAWQQRLLGRVMMQASACGEQVCKRPPSHGLHTSVQAVPGASVHARHNSGPLPSSSCCDFRSRSQPQCRHPQTAQRMAQAGLHPQWKGILAGAGAGAAARMNWCPGAGAGAEPALTPVPHRRAHALSI